MILLELRMLEIHSFLHFSPTCLDILSWNLVYDVLFMNFRSSDFHYLGSNLKELSPYRCTVLHTFLVHALRLSLSLLVFYVTSNDISVIYVTAQMLRRTEEVVVVPTVGSQRHRHFAGFFLHRHGTNLIIRWFWHTAQFSRLLRSR